MSDVKGLTTPSKSTSNDNDDRTAALKARWQTKKPATDKKATSVHLNPKPATHKPNDTSNK